VILPVRWNQATLAHEARCPDCGRLAFQLTREATLMTGTRAPFLARHECPNQCTCSTNPYNCPQGQALVAAIHERKGNQ
jgi:hypothetical protein